MRILVTGGRGFIGSHIIGALLQPPDRHELHILSRSPEPTKAGTRVIVHAGDVNDPPSLAAACRGIEVVLHCVQFPNHPIEDPKRGWTYLRVDGEGTRNMVAAAKDAGVRRFIYLSGLGTGPDRTEAWFRAKWMAEAAIRNSGMEHVIFRPSLVYGPEDRSLNRFIDMIHRLPIVPMIGNGRQHVQPVYVEELATLVAKAVELPTATNQVFEVGGPAYTMRGLFCELARLLGKRRTFVPIPKPFVKFGALFLQHLPSRPITPRAVDFVTMDTNADPTKTREIFDWTPKSLAENIRHYL